MSCNNIQCAAREVITAGHRRINWLWEGESVYVTISLTSQKANVEENERKGGRGEGRIRKEGRVRKKKV